MRAAATRLARLARRLGGERGAPDASTPTTTAAATTPRTRPAPASFASAATPPTTTPTLASARPAALVYSSLGPPEAALDLVPQHQHTGPPPPGTTRVRWLLAPVNWSDVNSVEGSYPGARPPPASPGNEGVGVVEAVGPADPADGDVFAAAAQHTPPLAPGDFVVPLSPGAGTWRSVGEVPTGALWRVRLAEGGGEGGSGEGSGGGGLTLDQAATLCIK